MKINTKLLAKKWIAEREKGDYLISKPDDMTAIDILMDLPRTNPEDTFNFILDVLNLSDSEKMVGKLGAGPLEDLLVYHGELAFEWIKANKDIPLLKECMSEVLLDEGVSFFDDFYEIAGVKTIT